MPKRAHSDQSTSAACALFRAVLSADSLIVLFVAFLRPRTNGPNCAGTAITRGRAGLAGRSDKCLDIERWYDPRVFVVVPFKSDALEGT